MLCVLRHLGDGHWRVLGPAREVDEHAAVRRAGDTRHLVLEDRGFLELEGLRCGRRRQGLLRLFLLWLLYRKNIIIKI